MNQIHALIGRYLHLQPVCFPKQPLWSHYAGCLVIAALGCFAIWHFMEFSDESNPDFVDFYYPVAQNIVAGNGVTLNGAPALAYPPGYPVIIAGVLLVSKTLGLRKEFSNRLFVFLCYLGCSILIYLSGRLFWESKTALIISGLWSCMPFTLFLNKTTSSEQPYMLFFYGCLLLFFTGLRAQRHRIPLFFAVGVLCGIAMLIRPVAIGLGGILITMLFLYGSLILLRHNRIFVF